ncbi:acyltransferase [Vibrio sp. AK197]
MLPSLILIINVLLVVLNCALCSFAISLLAIIKALLPHDKISLWMTTLANYIMWLWMTINALILKFSNNVDWQVSGTEGLSKKSWYLLISNHLSWTDIVVLCCVFKDRIPMPKFFLKQQLLYVPFIGMACWALDMPFMRRYSRAYLLRHPERRGQDLATTRRSCEKFIQQPTTVVNYVEGTRFTTEKHQKSGSCYQHLLAPKSGGIAYTLAAMGEQFDGILDVTVAYPGNRQKPFRDMLMGRMDTIVVDIQHRPLNAELQGDYFEDKQFKRQFRLWLDAIWQQKDQRLQQVHRDFEQQRGK